MSQAVDTARHIEGWLVRETSGDRSCGKGARLQGRRRRASLDSRFGGEVRTPPTSMWRVRWSTTSPLGASRSRRRALRRIGPSTRCGLAGRALGPTSARRPRHGGKGKPKQTVDFQTKIKRRRGLRYGFGKSGEKIKQVIGSEKSILGITNKSAWNV